MRIFPAAMELYANFNNKSVNPDTAIAIPHSGTNYVVIGPFPIEDFARIAGVVSSDKALSIAINQGIGPADVAVGGTPMLVTTVTCAAAGVQDFNVPTVGRCASIIITNTDSTNAVAVKFWASARAI